MPIFAQESGEMSSARRLSGATLRCEAKDLLADVGRRLEKPEAYSLESLRIVSGRVRDADASRSVCRSRMALLGQAIYTVNDISCLDRTYTVFGEVFRRHQEVVDKIVASARDERDNPLQRSR